MLQWHFASSIMSANSTASFISSWHLPCADSALFDAERCPRVGSFDLRLRFPIRVFRTLLFTPSMHVGQLNESPSVYTMLVGASLALVLGYLKYDTITLKPQLFCYATVYCHCNVKHKGVLLHAKNLKIHHSPVRLSGLERTIFSKKSYARAPNEECVLSYACVSCLPSVP